MQLEDYFEFDPCDRIRVKGTRIAIEYILEHYLDGAAAEEIVQEYYPSLSLEQVHATITYYLHNKAEVEAYLERSRLADEADEKEYSRQERPDVVKRLLALREQKAERATESK